MYRQGTCNRVYHDYYEKECRQWFVLTLASCSLGSISLSTISAFLGVSSRRRFSFCRRRRSLLLTFFTATGHKPRVSVQLSGRRRHATCQTHLPATCSSSMVDARGPRHCPTCIHPSYRCLASTMQTRY